MLFGCDWVHCVQNDGDSAQIIICDDIKKIVISRLQQTATTAYLYFKNENIKLIFFCVNSIYRL